VARHAVALAEAALSGALGDADAFAAWRGAARWPDLLHHRDDARQPA
jgi:glycine oxidase